MKRVLSCNRTDKRGFTLAEVLITLGIIGVVAALTIPALLSEYKKTQTVSKLKKAYTSLAQAVIQSEQDNGPNNTWDLGNDVPTIRNAFNLYFAPYLKILLYCENSPSTECGYGTTTTFNSLANTAYYAVVSKDTKTTSMLSDGTVIAVLYTGIVLVDVNGGKGPNMLGRDVFEFKLYPGKGLMPSGYDDTPTNITNGCKGTSGGNFCATKIIRDGWLIKDDYPWN